MALPNPLKIEQAGPDSLRIRWDDGAECVYAVRDLRLACRCAHCVDERTGAPLLEPDSVPPGVKPTAISSVGRYAIQFSWSDGHDTGIYTYEYLREMCP